MNNISRLLIIGGCILIGAGILLALFGKIPFLGKLPGDIHIQKGNFGLYFPLMTCLVISVVISLVFLIIRLMK